MSQPVFSPVDALFLRRRQAIILPAGESALPLAFVATALRNLESLGFVCAPRLIDRLCTLDEARFMALFGALREALSQMVGAHVQYRPMYPNFPEQVMATPAAELFVNAVMHSLGDWVGLRVMPVYEKTERAPLALMPDARPIRLGTLNELLRMGHDLIGAHTSISQTDKADVATLLAHFTGPEAEPAHLEALLPTEIPHKENLAFTAACLIDHPRARDIVLTGSFKTATDVLRLAVALSEGDVSLAEPTRFPNFSRARRRTLLALLDRVERPVEDMNRYAGRWIFHLGSPRTFFSSAALHPTPHLCLVQSAAKHALIRRSKRNIRSRSRRRSSRPGRERCRISPLAVGPAAATRAAKSSMIARLRASATGRQRRRLSMSSTARASSAAASASRCSGLSATANQRSGRWKSVAATRRSPPAWESSQLVAAASSALAHFRP